MESFNEVQLAPADSMGPPPKTRKRKAPTLRAHDWEPYKARILQLHVTEDRPLREVKQTMETDFGFVAEVRQYRKQISGWGEDKNIKPKEMSAIVRKRQRRKIAEPTKSQLIFKVRGHEVEEQKIERWMKRNGVSDSLPFSPSPSIPTPSAVNCRTISDRGSQVPSPRSVHNPLSPVVLGSIPQTPEAPSPALSVSSIVRPPSTPFAGQSPAPIYRPLPVQFQGYSPASMGQAQHANVAGYTPTHPVAFRYKQAEEEQLRKDLSNLESEFGRDHPLNFPALNELGYLLAEQGRYRSAEEVARRLVDGQKRTNADPLDLADSFNLLAVIFSSQGLYVKTERLLLQVIASRKNGLGEEHEKTLHSMGILASLQRKQERWGDAKKTGSQVFQIKKRVLGEEHRSTLFSMFDLVGIYTALGRWKEAEELGIHAVATCRRVLGDEDDLTLSSMKYLSFPYIRQKRWVEAENILRATLETRKRVFGEEHPETVDVMSSLVAVFKGQGRKSDAISLLKDSSRLAAKVLGHQHPDTIRSVAALKAWRMEGMRLDGF
ncbi:hypothetical protein BCR34DRAFT_482643 [Clohesyomyces aquaticus]|uniref:Clr5 domain-containing protein n=1 Tax=Clohesyomyces aquaticus TaxID=1231657 RepID=A0A1Y1ZQB9_9PLEO|nr:hypothetical protein BCR34DRAFT_482643 [Clohesyomyces aquaticus]